MAKNTVEIDIIVDDNGTVKKVALASKNASDGLGRVAKNARTADRNLKGAAQASSGAGKNFSKMAQGAGSFVGAYATLAANVFAISAAFHALKRAADIKNMEQGQLQFAQSTGKALGSVTRRLREASGGMLGFQKAAEAAAIGTAKGFSSAQLEELAVGARKASTALGRSYEDTFDRLVRGASKAEPELLDELGITLRLEDATKRYADAIGKVPDKLTIAEKSQAVLLETTRQLNENFGSVEAAVNPFVILQNTFIDIARAATDTVLPAFTKFADFLNKNATAAATLLGAVFVLILNSMTGIFGKMGNVLRSTGGKFLSFGRVAGKGLGFVGAAAEKSADAVIKSLEKQEAAIQAGKSKAGEQAGGFIRGGSKSKILTKMSKGKTLGGRDKATLARALKAAEAQMKEHGEITSGIFINADKKALAHFKKSMKDMDRSALTTTQKFKKYTAKGMVGSLKAVRVAAKVTAKTIRGIGTVARWTGKAIKGAMAMTGILAVIGGMALAFDEVMKKPATFVTNIVKMVKNVAMGLQGLLNLVATGINKLSTKLPDWVKEYLGIDKGEALITPFQFADNIDIKGLEDMAYSVLGTTRAQAAKTEEVNVALEKQQEIMEDLQSSYRDTASEAGNVFKAITEATGTDKGRAAAETLSTLGISSELEKLSKLDKESDRQKALTTLVESLKREGIESALPGILEMIQKQQISKVRELEDAGQIIVTNLAGIKSSIDSLGTMVSSDNLLGAELFIESLRESAVTADLAAEKIPGVVGAVEQVEAAFKSQGGAEAFYQNLKANRIEITRLKSEISGLGADKRTAGRAPTAMAAQLNLEIAAREALLVLQLKETELTRLNNALKLETNAENIITLKQQIKDLKDDITNQELKVSKSEENASRIAQLGKTIGQSLETNMTTAFNSLVQGTMSAKDAFASMAKSILADIASMITKMLVFKMLQGAFGTSDFGKWIGIGKERYGGITVGYGKSAMGYATGGIAKGSQAGYPAMLHGTEAVVPLPNGKSIPVEMSGSGTNNISINVNMDSAGNSQTSGEKGKDTGGQLGKLLAAAVQDELHKQKRPGGLLSPLGATG